MKSLNFLIPAVLLAAGCASSSSQVVVAKPGESAGYKALVEMGLEDMSYEQVVLRHRDAFSEKAVAASEARLQRLKA